MDYATRIQRVPPLALQEEMELARQLQGWLALEPLEQLERQGEARSIRRRLVEGHLPLVVAIARLYQGRGLELADLIQEGNLGLIAVADRFAPDRGCRFSTYAYWWIRRAISQAIADQGRMIRLPAHLQRRMARVRSTLHQRQRQGEPPPSKGEVAAMLGIETGRLHGFSQVLRPPLSLMPGEALGWLGQEPAVEAVSEPDDLEASLARLPLRERELLQFRYGLVDGQSCTLQQAAGRFGVSRERIRQLEARAFRRLRRA